ncbi:hypothetical protein [Maribacter sp. ACAM166]|uniref:hypothetical protein n=1 Tax=Maribacter sp. ACAM166 TaxID=2508996 RepID=UPI0010FD7455|nr:hypothetical protein [Maribacter sp. ACAM166]TLP73058.1 hypothetical protein ES765_17740 [Maribacter sp. ACAM166]
METDKFEKHIRSQFKEREINPSVNAWEKISAELTTEVSTKKPVYMWMGIAASVVVLIGISLFFLNDGNEVEDPYLEVVEISKDEQSEVKQVNKTLPFELREEPTIVYVETKSDINTDVTSAIRDRDQTISKKKKIRFQNQIEVAAVAELASKSTAKKLGIPENIINNKVAEIVAKIDILEQYNSVSDAEVDSLLKRAQDEILRNKVFTTKKSVDAMALLTAVEDELDQSFRDQIFNSLKAGFIKVRTAVADRNN